MDNRMFTIVQNFKGSFELYQEKKIETKEWNYLQEEYH